MKTSAKAYNPFLRLYAFTDAFCNPKIIERGIVTMTYMGSESVVSVAYFVEDEKLKNDILRSDYIRNETLRRLCAMPSYKYKSLKWKNTYYDYFKRKVERELLSA